MTLSAHPYAVIDDADQDASYTINAQVFNDTHFPCFPVKGVCRTSFDAELTFHSFTGTLFDPYATVFKEFLYTDGLKKLSSPFSSSFPIFKIIPVVLVISIIFLKNAVTRPFSVYVGITYVLFAFLQSIAINEKYGLGILTTNVIMFNLVAAFWLWEAIIQKTILRHKNNRDGSIG